MYATKHEGMSEAELVCGFIFTEETQTAIECNTTGQADNPPWFELRKGRINVSKFHDVYTAKVIQSSAIGVKLNLEPHPLFQNV